MAPTCTRNNHNAQIETHKHELNGLLVGGIRHNKGSHKLGKSKQIRSDAEKEEWRRQTCRGGGNGSNVRAEEAVRVMMQGIGSFKP